MPLYAIPLPDDVSGSGALSTMPRPRGGEWLDEEMAGLRAAGVDVLVCLLESDERSRLDLADEPAAAVRAGMEYREHGIVDFGVPEPAAIAPVLDGIVAAIRDGRHVVVHCHGGVGRSSLVAGAVLVRLGVPVDEAWERISTARGVPVPETDDQRAWLAAHPLPSPRVLSVAWGAMEVEGLGRGKDFKLYPGGGREWDWSETGTRHSPGIQPSDVEELVRRGAVAVVLSRGMELRLEVDPATLAYLDESNITVHVAQTTEAVAVYNELAATTPVGALFHTTC